MCKRNARKTAKRNLIRDKVLASDVAKKNYKALPVPVTGVSEGMDGCVIWSTKTLKFISVPVVLKHLFRCLKLYLHHIQEIN